MIKDISNTQLAIKDDFLEAYKKTKALEEMFVGILNDEKLMKVFEDIKDFQVNGTHIMDAKNLTSKLDFQIKEYTDAIKTYKAQLDFLKKPILQVEKLFTLLKSENKKIIDRKRFDLQEKMEQELREKAIMTVQVEDAGMIKRVEVVDQVAMKEIDKTKKMVGFLKDRLTNERISIRGFGALETALRILKENTLDDIIEPTLKLSSIQENVKKAFLDKNLDKVKEAYLKKGIEIEVTE